MLDIGQGKEDIGVWQWRCQLAGNRWPVTSEHASFVVFSPKKIASMFFNKKITSMLVNSDHLVYTDHSLDFSCLQLVNQNDIYDSQFLSSKKM